MGLTAVAVFAVFATDLAAALILTRKQWAPARRAELLGFGPAIKFFGLLYLYLFFLPIVMFFALLFLQIGFAALGFEFDSGAGIDILSIFGVPYLLLTGTVIFPLCWLAILSARRFSAR
jgi:hypothetical protein